MPVTTGLHRTSGHRVAMQGPVLRPPGGTAPHTSADANRLTGTERTYYNALVLRDSATDPWRQFVDGALSDHNRSANAMVEQAMRGGGGGLITRNRFDRAAGEPTPMSGLYSANPTERQNLANLQIDDIHRTIHTRVLGKRKEVPTAVLNEAFLADREGDPNEYGARPYKRTCQQGLSRTPMRDEPTLPPKSVVTAIPPGAAVPVRGEATGAGASRHIGPPRTTAADAGIGAPPPRAQLGLVLAQRHHHHPAPVAYAVDHYDGDTRPARATPPTAGERAAPHHRQSTAAFDDGGGAPRRPAFGTAAIATVTRQLAVAPTPPADDRSRSWRSVSSQCLRRRSPLATVVLSTTDGARPTTNPTHTSTPVPTLPRSGYSIGEGDGRPPIRDDGTPHHQSVGRHHHGGLVATAEDAGLATDPPGRSAPPVTGGGTPRRSVDAAVAAPDGVGGRGQPASRTATPQQSVRLAVASQPPPLATEAAATRTTTDNTHPPVWHANRHAVTASDDAVDTRYLPRPAPPQAPPSAATTAQSITSNPRALLSGVMHRVSDACRPAVVGGTASITSNPRSLLAGMMHRVSDACRRHLVVGGGSAATAVTTTTVGVGRPQRGAPQRVTAPTGGVSAVMTTTTVPPRDLTNDGLGSTTRPRRGMAGVHSTQHRGDMIVPDRAPPLVTPPLPAVRVTVAGAAEIPMLPPQRAGPPPQPRTTILPPLTAAATRDLLPSLAPRVASEPSPRCAVVREPRAAVAPEQARVVPTNDERPTEPPRSRDCRARAHDEWKDRVVPHVAWFERLGANPRATSIV